MSNVGNVELSVSLSLAKLQRDAAAANELLKQQLKDPIVAPKFDNSKFKTGDAGAEVKELASDFIALGRSLNLSLGEAKQFAAGLGLTADETTRAISLLKGLESVNATNAEKFKVLSAEAGLTLGQVKKLNDALQASKPIPPIKISTGADISELARSLNASYKEAQQFSEALGVTADVATSAVGRLRQLQQAGASLDDQFKELNREFGLTEDQFKAISSAATKTDNSIFGVAKRFQEQVAATSQYTQALGEVSRQLDQAAQATNNFANQAAQAAIAFDSARAKVATLTNESEKFADASRQLAKDLNFQQNSTDLLAASYDVLSSGFSEVADVNKILEASAKGAQGGFSDIGTVSDATTTILNAYKLSAEDAARVVDILAVTQDKGKITIDQYAQSVGRAASIAALSGVSFEEFSAAVATATAKGVPAESAVSGVRQAIVNLLKPTADAQALLEKYGISSGAAALQSVGLVGVLQQLGNIPTDELSKIFSDVDALTSITPLAGSNLKDLQANLDAVNNSSGKAAKSAEQVANSFQGKTTAALNQANDALVSLGNGVTNAINPLLDALTGLLLNFNQLPEPIKEATGTAIALTGGTLSLVSALAGLAAILPVIKAGFLAAKTAAAGYAASMAALAPFLVAVAAGVAAISFVKFVADVAAAQQEIEKFTINVEALANNAFDAASRTKAAVDKLNAAKQSGRALNDQEVADAKALASANDARIAKLKEELAATQEQIRISASLGGVDEAQTKAKENLAKQLEITIGALSKQNDALKKSIAPAKASIAVAKEQKSALEAATVAYGQQTAAIEAAYRERQIAIANSTGNGLSQDQAQQQQLAAEQAFLNKRVALNQQQLAKLRDIQQFSKNAEDVKKAGEEIVKIEQQVGDDRLRVSQNAASQRLEAARKAEDERKAAIQKRLDEITAANERAEQAITQSQNNRIAAIKAGQLNGSVGEEEAARQIAAIQQQATSEAIAQKQREISEVAKLRQEGVLSEEEALTKTSALQGEITNLNLQRIDQELAARKAAAAQQIQLAEQQLQVQQQVAQARLDAGSQGIQAELDLLSAATGLQEAQKNLSVERLNTQLKIAEAAGDEATAARLKLQITQTEQGFEDKVYQVKLKQLELTKQQKNLELERQRLTAQNAIEEAKLSILKAEQSGATAEEISGLQRILAVRQQQLGLVDRQQSTLDQLSDLERKTLETQQQITAEKRRQAALDGQAIQDASTKNQLEQQRPGFTVSGADIQQSRNAGQALQSTSGALNALTGPNPNRFVADLASPVVRQLAALANTGLSGRIQASDLAQQVDRGLLTADDVGRKLDQLIAATNRSSGRPNLSISNVQDLSLAGRIYSDISRDQLRSGGL